MLMPHKISRSGPSPLEPQDLTDLPQVVARKERTTHAVRRQPVSTRRSQECESRSKASCWSAKMMAGA